MLQPSAMDAARDLGVEVGGRSGSASFLPSGSEVVCFSDQQKEWPNVARTKHCSERIL
jgi:hypothetical protein